MYASPQVKFFRFSTSCMICWCRPQFFSVTYCHNLKANEIFVHERDASYWFYVTIMSSRAEKIVHTSIQYGYNESINKEIRSAEVVF